MDVPLPEIQRVNDIDIMCSQNLDGLSEIEATMLDRYETTSKSGADLKPLLLVLDGEYSEFDAKVQHFAKIARGLGVHVVCINIDAARNLSGTTLDLFNTRILLPMYKDSSCALCGCGIAGVMSQDGSQLVYYVKDTPHWDIVNIEGVLV